MPDLPARPNLDQFRHQAKDLLRAARNGDRDAAARIGAVSDQLILSAAQLALAREYGFSSWARLKLEVERRDILNRRDLSRLTSLLAEHPDLAFAGWSTGPTATATSPSATSRICRSTMISSGSRATCPEPGLSPAR